jgi:hypothetical protein
LLLELLLWFELELLLWFELELELWLELEFELELLLRLGLPCEPDEARFMRLIVRLFSTARARHHSIGFPSILRSTGTDVRAARSEIGATVAWSSFERAAKGSRAAPTAIPMAPNTPAYIARILWFRNAISHLPSRERPPKATVNMHPSDQGSRRR